MFKQDNLLRYDARHIGSFVSTGEATVTPEIKVTSNMYENENVPKTLAFKVESEVEGRLEVSAVLYFPYEIENEHYSYEIQIFLHQNFPYTICTPNYII